LMPAVTLVQHEPLVAARMDEAEKVLSRRFLPARITPLQRGPQRDLVLCIQALAVHAQLLELIRAVPRKMLLQGTLDQTARRAFPLEIGAEVVEREQCRALFVIDGAVTPIRKILHDGMVEVLADAIKAVLHPFGRAPCGAIAFRLWDLRLMIADVELDTHLQPLVSTPLEKGFDAVPAILFCFRRVRVPQIDRFPGLPAAAKSIGHDVPPMIGYNIGSLSEVSMSSCAVRHSHLRYLCWR